MCLDLTDEDRAELTRICASLSAPYESSSFDHFTRFIVLPDSSPTLDAWAEKGRSWDTSEITLCGAFVGGEYYAINEFGDLCGDEAVDSVTKPSKVVHAILLVILLTIATALAATAVAIVLDFLPKVSP